MKIDVWDKIDKINAIGRGGQEPTYTIEISNEEIDHFIRMFGESFGMRLVEQ